MPSADTSSILRRATPATSRSADAAADAAADPAAILFATENGLGSDPKAGPRPFIAATVDLKEIQASQALNLLALLVQKYKY